MLSVRDIVTKRIPSKHLPSCVIRYLEHIVHQDEANTILAHAGDKQGVDFLQSVLHDELHISLHLSPVTCNLSPVTCNSPQGVQPVIFVSNHPLGGADGMLLLQWLNEHRPNRVRVIVNDLLMHIQPLRDLFVPVNKVGAQRREYVAQEKALWESGDDVLTFPSGACSRWQQDGTIADPEWKDTFIRRAITYQRDIVPIYFEGKNSNFFYRLAYWRQRLGIKTNIEMLYLADELFKARGKAFGIRIGEPIAWETLDSSRTTKQWAEWVRSLTYQMAK